MARRRVLSLIERDPIVREAVDSLPGPVGERLLSALIAAPNERAELIGRLHCDPARRPLAEFLIDLEDRQLGLDFAQALKDAGR